MCIPYRLVSFFYGGGWLFFVDGCLCSRASFTWVFFCPSFCCAGALASMHALNFLQLCLDGHKSGRKIQAQPFEPYENQKKYSMCIWMNSVSLKKFVSSISVSLVSIENEHTTSGCLSKKFLLQLWKNWCL